MRLRCIVIWVLHLDNIGSWEKRDPGAGWSSRLKACWMSCRVQYTSGEFEELDLEETIREGHMSLITR